MTEKRISSYVVHKHDIEVNWNASNLVPEKGQFIVYDKEIDSEGNISTLPEGRTEPYTYERFKIGDGIRTVKELPFNNEIYIGDGDMPEGATIQIIMDAVDEEESLINQLEEYIDSKIEEGLSGVDTKIENSLNELDTEDIKYSVEGSFVHQQGFDGTLHEALSDYSNAIANSYESAMGAIGGISEIWESISSMGESFSNALWAENGLEPRVSELEAFLGYTDDDIIGLSADFENNSFTRLAGARGLEAGEDFNKFPVYRDRVRCNVTNNGQIIAIYGETSEGGSIIICNPAIVSFGKMGNDEDPDSVGGAGSILPFTSVPHPTDCGKPIKVQVLNKTTGISYENLATLGVTGGDPSVSPILCNFIDSNGKTIDLRGWPTGEPSGENTMSYYGDGFQLFIYDYCTDELEISVELLRSITYSDDGSNGQCMVYQPAFYYRVVPIKLEKQENGIGYHIRKANYYISSIPKPGFKLHPAFYDKNDKPVRYILYSVYECQSFDGDEQNPPSLSSIAGIIPSNNVVRPQAEAYAQTRGENWHIENIQAISANQLLMMLEYAHPNVQSIFAKGAVSVPSNNFIVTGSTSALGNTSGSAVSSTDSAGNAYTEDGSVAVTYRGMENPWGNVAKHVHGLYSENFIDNMDKQKIFIYSKGNQYNEATSGSFCGFTVEQGHGSAFGYGNEEYDWLLIPSEGNGSSEAPIGDLVLFNSFTEYIAPYTPVIGGWCTSGEDCGLFSFDFYGISSFNTACRLLYTPMNNDDSSNIV